MSDRTVSEERRLAALDHYEVLGTAPEADFDDIAVLADRLCRAPAAAVSLVGAERRFLKAQVGFDTCDVAREHSFCAHAMLGAEVMQVPDARPRRSGGPPSNCTSR